MKEVAVLLNKYGVPLEWWSPQNAHIGAIPDSKNLWDLIWKHREQLGGIGHTHPFTGPSWPSQTDVTTFSAIERGLGKRLIWPIITLSEVICFQWQGPDKLYYVPICYPNPSTIDTLRQLSTQGVKNG